MAGAVARALDLLLPAGCVSCRTWMPRPDERDGAPICARCRSRLRIPGWPRCVRCHAPVGRRAEGATELGDGACHECRSWPPALASARSACILAGPGAKLVHALKYEGWHELAGFMGDRIADVARRHPVVVHASSCREPGGCLTHSVRVTPVPTTPSRERIRGYNQAALLAQGVATALGVRLVPMLKRTAGRRSQIELEPGLRRANVRDVFAPSSGISDARRRDVLLVDDVLTTGATAVEAASVLSDHGARSVHLVSFARALPKPDSTLP
jgi:predicted amidophosphoribosyltransferase